HGRATDTTGGSSTRTLIRTTSVTITVSVCRSTATAATRDNLVRCGHRSTTGNALTQTRTRVRILTTRDTRTDDLVDDRGDTLIHRLGQRRTQLYSHDGEQDDTDGRNRRDDHHHRRRALHTEHETTHDRATDTYRSITIDAAEVIHQRLLDEAWDDHHELLDNLVDKQRHKDLKEHHDGVHNRLSNTRQQTDHRERNRS